MIGYGSKEPKVVWPNNAKLALQIVLNYEEGGESNILHGDKHSETFLSEIIGAQEFKDRHINMESMYEYGSRRGFWRLHKLFKEKKIPITIFGVAMALERNPEVCEAIKNGNYEIACHGWRWIDYQNVKKSTEKKDMKLAIKTIKKIEDLAQTENFLTRSSELNCSEEELKRVACLSYQGLSQKARGDITREYLRPYFEACA